MSSSFAGRSATRMMPTNSSGACSPSPPSSSAQFGTSGRCSSRAAAATAGPQVHHEAEVQIPTLRLRPCLPLRTRTHRPPRSHLRHRGFEHPWRGSLAPLWRPGNSSSTRTAGALDPLVRSAPPCSSAPFMATSRGCGRSSPAIGAVCSSKSLTPRRRLCWSRAACSSRSVTETYARPGAKVLVLRSWAADWTRLISRAPCSRLVFRLPIPNCSSGFSSCVLASGLSCLTICRLYSSGCRARTEMLSGDLQALQPIPSMPPTRFPPIVDSWLSRGVSSIMAKTSP
mmetsp:Transcript_61387/g.132850  ORF Transcript_61387/g.132850 Transcript_61387/m.132850 type:complete len:285 (+) Transcript_61387:1477-2331(+)